MDQSVRYEFCAASQCPTYPQTARGTVLVDEFGVVWVPMTGGFRSTAQPVNEAVLASQAEAEGGTENTKLLTSLRTWQAARATTLAGLSTATRAGIAGATTMLAAFGLLQAQVSSPWGPATTIASATTPAIGAAATPYIVLTGTTSVTGFDTAAPIGAERKIRFAGAVPLVHGANLILRGGVSRTATVDDVSDFLYEGSSVWREVKADVPGGSGGGGGGGSDRTAVTAEASPSDGYRPIAETVDGIPWTNITYDVFSREIARAWVAGGLTRTISYASGLGVASGNIIRAGGEVTVTVSQMAALKTALIALGAGMVGVPRFFVSDFDGGRGTVVEWNDIDACFRGVNGPVSYAGFVVNSSAHQLATESAALRTITCDGWLAGPRTRYIVDVEVTKAGETDTTFIRVKVGGSTILSSSASAGANNFFYGRGAIQAVGATNSQRFVSNAFTDAGAVSSAVHSAATIDMTANQDFTVTLQMGGTTDPAFVARFVLIVLNP